MITPAHLKGKQSALTDVLPGFRFKSHEVTTQHVSALHLRLIQSTCQSKRTQLPLTVHVLSRKEIHPFLLDNVEPQEKASDKKSSATG
jgi:hypothetical protein